MNTRVVAHQTFALRILKWLQEIIGYSGENQRCTGSEQDAIASHIDRNQFMVQKLLYISLIFLCIESKISNSRYCITFCVNAIAFAVFKKSSFVSC